MDDDVVNSGNDRRGRRRAVKGEVAASEIIVAEIDQRATILSAEPPRVFAVDPREVVEDLVGLADAPPRNAEDGGTEVFDGTVEINFRDSELAGPEIQAIGGQRIDVVIERSKLISEARVAESHFVQKHRAKHREPTARA